MSRLGRRLGLCACMVVSSDTAVALETAVITPEGGVHPLDGSVPTARPFDGSTKRRPTRKQMDQDIWTTPEVSWTMRSPISRVMMGMHSSVFEVLPGGTHVPALTSEDEDEDPVGRYRPQKVVVVDHKDAAAWAPTRIPCDLADGPEWNAMAAAEGEPVTTDQCWYDNEEEMHRAALEFIARFADVLADEFGVAKETCQFARGLYATRAQRGYEADQAWHHDVCRAEPHIFLTALSYPHDEGWKPKWRGHTEFARVDCAVEPPPRTNETPPALRVAPMLNRTVIFSGRIYHTTSRAKARRRSRRTDPQSSRSRYSLVLRLHCQAAVPRPRGRPKKRGGGARKGTRGLG